jgi:hypothetical protein
LLKSHDPAKQLWANSYFPQKPALQLPATDSCVDRQLINGNSSMTSDDPFSQANNLGAVFVADSL